MTGVLMLCVRIDDLLSDRGGCSEQRDTETITSRPYRRHQPVAPQFAIHNCVRRSRSALPITDTELNVIAALAQIGLIRIPRNG